MLKSVIINKLFGRFDYRISFSERGIVIITGPNGYGKSTILRMIEDLCCEKLEELLKVEFSSFQLIGENSSIIIEKKTDCFLINSYSFPYSKDISSQEWRRYQRYIDEETIELLYAPGGMRKINMIENQQAQKNKVDKYLEFVIYSLHEDKSSRELISLRSEAEKATKELEIVRQDIGEVTFIREQRLIETRTNKDSYRSEEKVITVINENSDKLRASLAEIMKRHSQLSSELDSTYVKRLFETDQNSVLDVSKMQSDLTDLQKKQEKYKKYGLTGTQNSTFFNPQGEKLKTYSTLLSIYIQDANAKYNIFEDIIRKLELYEEIVNQKLSFKTMKLSSSRGIMVESAEGKDLPLDSLSSGEQEILVLFYKLIFESDVKLLLIDEPEISLHIAWQKELLENLKSILRLKPDMQVIIATHSPQIISNNWELQVDLGEQYNG